MATRTVRRRTPARKTITLALQGGGSHGAFTWGVLDELLADERIEVEGISGTSAGAMNAVLVADGLADGNREHAREKLHEFWRALSDASQLSPIQRTFFDRLMGSWSLDASPGYLMFDLMSRSISPYDWNPLDINPLRDLLQAHVDFDRVRGCERPHVYVTATSVHTGKARIFERADISADAVMASSCLPHMFRTVVIDGEGYWDGGYIGNPALYPLIYHCRSRDIMLVQVNPLHRPEIPTSARDIVNRLNELVFAGNLIREMRAIEFIGRLLDEEGLSEEKYKRVLMHVIDAQDALAPLNSSSKFNAEWPFLLHLHDIGRTAARAWLAEHADDLGRRSTVDIKEMFL